MESIIIVGAGIMQIPAIKTAKEMGLNVIATDMNPNAAGFEFADVKVILNTKDIEGHIKFALENREKYNIVGAFAGADVARTVAGITKALKLPGVSEYSAFISNNKWEMKKLWLKDGIPTPDAIEVKNMPEAEFAVKKIGFPCMVKAIDNAASRGTKKIDDMSQLKEAFEDACINSTTNTAIIEEFVDGLEYSAETVIYQGIQYKFGIAFREFNMLPLPIETGHVNPAVISKQLEDEMYEIVKKAAQSLMIDNGPAKADLMVDRKTGRVLIIEMPARLSGGFHSQYTTPLSTGMNPIKFVMQIAVGIKPDMENCKEIQNNTAVCRALFPKPGLIKEIRGLDKALEIEGVKQIFMLVKSGDIIEDYRHCADRVCYVITAGENYEEADEIFYKVKNTIDFIIE